jgi:hypothetical protein
LTSGDTGRGSIIVKPSAPKISRDKIPQCTHPPMPIASVTRNMFWQMAAGSLNIK